jgi:hypothetical protein
MYEFQNAFISRQFLRSHWALDFEAFRDSAEEAALFERLRRWSARADLKETSAVPAFLDEFFHRTWDYIQSGQPGAEEAFSLYPEFPVRGYTGHGSADAALGWFRRGAEPHVPQVLCEFKDIRSALETPQKRKKDNRSPVRQGLDYLAAARRGLFGNEPIVPTWAIISDMNEFRLYWADRGDRQFIRFVIQPRDLLQGPSLLAETEEARFDRFLFARLFHRDVLTIQAESGRAPLLALIEQQRFRQRELENEFYADYRAYREHLYRVLLAHNDEHSGRFPGTRGRLVRLAQKILDRCIFVFFCEDMGRALRFPPQLVRNFLMHRSSDPYLDPHGGEVWRQLLQLFRAMNDGSAFGGEPLNAFNGGLFAPDPALEALFVPNSAFFERGQAQNEASLARNKRTLLYLCAAYNYAAGWSDGLGAGPADAPGGRGIGLYTLGRIFEQSITELEILEAEADDRPSVNKESKRKRDGVYYTPEWVVERIVSETVGARLADLKAECGWPPEGSSDLPDADAIHAYDRALRQITILDPACGSGAFLITALRYLLDEWRALRTLRRERLGETLVRDEDALIRDILESNIYGVDINAASVEITKLALWLHTARGDRPLSSLDRNIREGNSLIGPEFYDGLAPYSAEERERINAFDWQAGFPEVFARGGFDVVVGNPPYVKLQNFKRVHGDMARFLAEPPERGGRYESTQTGNFDLYLPFIERGISLLNPKGRLGYIAPSLWTVNEYGAGLRAHIARGRHLYGWIDFGSFQVFEEATTYTALQFYARAPADAVRIARVPDGVVPANPWVGDDAALPYGRLDFGDRWLLVVGLERTLIDRLDATCLRLEHPGVTRGIFVGIQTSADAIYHLKKRGPGRYLCDPPGKGAQPYEAQIEDAVMKPLVSGTEAKRYVTPRTDTYLLFPYRVGPDGATLISASEMATQFPLAWSYLRSWERELRRRENGAFEDDQWWRFGRHQNLDKQELPKLIVAQTVPSLRLCADAAGEFYLNNVRVNGIVPARQEDLWWLLGVLNSLVCDFVFRRIAKPKDGGYFEANRQFIAPLPIPDTPDTDRAAVAERARRLQTLHTERRDILAEIDRRRQTIRFRDKPEEWLFPDIPTARDFAAKAPAQLDAEAKKQWAEAQRATALDDRYATIDARLRPGVALSASFANGELRFLVDGVAVIDRVFVDPEEGAFIAAIWDLIASTQTVSERTTGKRLADMLRKVRTDAPPALRRQIIDLQTKLAQVEGDIAAEEAAMNAHVYRLYGLSDEEIRLVERG